MRREVIYRLCLLSHHFFLSLLLLRHGRKRNERWEWDSPERYKRRCRWNVEQRMKLITFFHRIEWCCHSLSSSFSLQLGVDASAAHIKMRGVCGRVGNGAVNKIQCGRMYFKWTSIASMKHSPPTVDEAAGKKEKERKINEKLTQINRTEMEDS